MVTQWYDIITCPVTLIAWTVCPFQKILSKYNQIEKVIGLLQKRNRQLRHLWRTFHVFRPILRFVIEGHDLQHFVFTEHLSPPMSVQRTFYMHVFCMCAFQFVPEVFLYYIYPLMCHVKISILLNKSWNWYRVVRYFPMETHNVFPASLNWAH